MSGRAPRPARLAVLVPTVGRDPGLRDLLDALRQQSVGEDEVQITVVVADNRPSAATRGLVRSYDTRGRFALWYVEVAERGLSRVRNALLGAAPPSDWYVFVDDDEVPAPAWLAALLQAVADGDCMVAAGPVHRRFEGALPRWARRSGAFEEPNRPAGVVEVAGCGNLAVSAAALSRLDPPYFDERFDRIGGEDTDFTSRLSRTGVSIRWVPEAAVTEMWPAARLTRRWLVRRAFREGQVLALVASKSGATPVRIVASGVARALAAAAVAMLCAPVPSRRVKNSLRFVRACGFVSVSGEAVVRR